MIYDKYTGEKIFTVSDMEGKILREGGSVSFSFDENDLNPQARHSLFFTCEDKMNFALKDEPYGEKLYMLIDDSLNGIEAEHDRFSLDMSCEKAEQFEKIAFKKIPFQPPKYGDYAPIGSDGHWKLGIRVKADGLKIQKGGYLRLRFESWDIKPGVELSYTGNKPDKSIFIDIPEGSYSYRELSEIITIDEKATACTAVSVEGLLYEGRVWFECPKLSSSDGYNLLPPFDTCISKLSALSWVGMNLSKKEWPRFEISLNGRVFFCGERFLSIHRFPHLEFDIPEGILEKGENTITIKYLSHYHDTVPLEIGEVILIEKEKEDFSVIYAPNSAAYGRDINILVEAFQANTEIHLESDMARAVSELCFETPGLYVLKIRPEAGCDYVEFTLNYKNSSYTKKISLYEKQGEDNVVCGSGDLIYVDMSDEKRVADFLKWYIANELGNLLTVRPVYRWGGQRYINESAYMLFKRICCDMDISYVHLSDGRDLPGLCQNPPADMIDSPAFLGRQLHERDGQLFYWGVRPKENDPACEDFFDLALRLSRENPDTVEGAYRAFNVSLADGEYSFTRNIDCDGDMEKAASLAADTISKLSADNFPRHTGPSVMFKYLYQNGFKWLGAETMDGSLETLLSFIRGASKAYGADSFGVHHALQWSTRPHDNAKRYRRYLLALFISYMHGASVINTEEGFYFLESAYYYHNRLSEACSSHRDMERRFYSFVKHNLREGELYANTALIHGRLDGWNGFSYKCLWGMPSLPIGDDAASWKLLNVFYPLCQVDEKGLKLMGYVDPNIDKPIGYFSGTPRGSVDVVPIEKGDLSGYKLLCFAGYNKAESADMDRLYSFVNGGGTLIASWQHFSTITKRCDIMDNKLKLIDHPLTRALSAGKPKLAAGSINGTEILYCKNISESAELLKKTEDAAPLVYRVQIGKGSVVLLNCNLYPGNEAVYDIYKELIEKYNDLANNTEDIKVSCGLDVEYVIYKTPEKCSVYLTPVDWYNDADTKRRASITANGKTVDLELEFGEITKISI